MLSLKNVQRIFKNNINKRNFSTINTKTHNIISYYLPFCPRPRISIDEKFMEKLRYDPKDHQMIKNEKKYLHNYFIKKYPNTIVNYSPHYKFGVLSRLVIHVSGFSLSFGEFGTQPTAIVIYIIIYLCIAERMCEEPDTINRYNRLIIINDLYQRCMLS
jgi:hypothetical protein